MIDTPFLSASPRETELDILPPEEQVYLLNKRLICNAQKLASPVITVGGQAVQYWFSYYLEKYVKSPDIRLITSIDCDYSAQKNDVLAIANILNINRLNFNNGHPPSIAQFMLIDKDTKSISIDNGRLFAIPGEPDVANVVDIIDHPSGFSFDDFRGDKLLLHTSPFYIKPDGPDVPMMDDKVRVLNPIACIRSRFSNLTNLRRDPEIECARINALKIPCYYFLIEAFDSGDFKFARQQLMQLYYLANDNKNLIYQSFFDNLQNPMGQDQQSNNITLVEILNAVYVYLDTNRDDFDLNDKFIDNDLKEKVLFSKDKLEKYKRLCKENACRSPRKRFEIN